MKTAIHGAGKFWHNTHEPKLIEVASYNQIPELSGFEGSMK